MSALICDICGGKLLVGSGGIAKCDSCGTEHTKERIQEKVQEIKGTVQVEGTVQTSSTAQQIETAQRHIAKGNYKAAQKIYDTLAMEYPAEFDKGLDACNLLEKYRTEIKYVRWSQPDLRNIYKQALQIAPNNLRKIIILEDETYWNNLIEKLSTDPKSLIEDEDYAFIRLQSGSEKAIAFYDESIKLAKTAIDSLPKNKQGKFDATEFIKKVSSDEPRYFYNDSKIIALNKNLLVIAWETSNSGGYSFAKTAHNFNRNNIENIISSLNLSAPANDKKQKSGCYIATAVYGSYDAPQVLTLRNFRDELLMSHVLGRVFVRIYYKLSPPIANKLRNFPVINRFVKSLLDKWVNHLQNK